MEAARLRLRPILMTAFAFILGVVPLMLATGAGAASRQSIGTTVFGGMLAATILTLIFVPVFYAVIEQWRERRSSGIPVAAHGAASHAAGGIRMESHVMRNWKIGHRHRRSCCSGRRCHHRHSQRRSARRRPGRRGDAQPRDDGHAGPGGENRQEDDPDLPRLFGAHGIDPQRHAAGQGLGLSEAAARAGRGRRRSKGDLLYTIDPRDFQAALDQAKAQVQRDEAALDLCAR